ncbi:hypothetical protein VTN00DRAFT_206 [Thermoascus crustaceus]|uniref:uncharacterized protein n=1 Tax=Thermoascus crustaceus TaxID=5088 RepID=UPI003743A658
MTSGPSASLFSLPLAQWQQPQSNRIAKYEPRKRRRKVDDWGDEDDIEGETTDATSAPETVGSFLVLSPDEAHQYRIAGLPFDQELPGGNFPHAAPKEETSSRTTKKSIDTELSSLSPPIYVPQSAAQQGNLRLQHLAVITAILHRCLLEGDYIRAGRAWGLILREEFAGHPIDVRNESRWGIGAEILLRRDRQISQQAAGLRGGNAQTGPKSWFTRKGFEDAKEYYEKLILQYPYRKAAPDAISSLDFYPAMFGLWIYVVQEESNVAREALQHHDEESDGASSEEDDVMSGSELSPKRGKRRQRLIAEIRAKELEQAQQIAGRMDELMVSPPYSDSPDLLRLRGMLSLWIGDLFVLSLPQENDDRDLQSDPGSISPDELPESIQARREQRLAMEKKDIELKKSREFFEKAKQRGKGVAHSLEDFHIDDALG